MRYLQITPDERYRLAALRTQHPPLSNAEIARQLGRHPSTVARELRRNAARHDGAYRPSKAQERTNGRRSRTRRGSTFTARQWMFVEGLLVEGWSPEQISGRLRRDGILRISYETILQVRLGGQARRRIVASLPAAAHEEASEAICHDRAARTSSRKEAHRGAARCCGEAAPGRSLGDRHHSRQRAGFRGDVCRACERIHPDRQTPERHCRGFQPARAQVASTTQAWPASDLPNAHRRQRNGVSQPPRGSSGKPACGSTSPPRITRGSAARTRTRTA